MHFQNPTSFSCNFRLSWSSKGLYLNGMPNFHLHIDDLDQHDRRAQNGPEAEQWHGALEFRALAETIPSLVIALTASGRCIYANSTALRQAAKGSDGVMGARYLRSVDAVQRRSLLSAWRRAQASRDPFEVELKLSSPEGSWQWHLVRGAPVIAADGQANRWIVSCTNVHTLRTALAAAEDATELLKVVGASTDALVFAKDGAGRMIYANEAALKAIGATSAEVLGQVLDGHAQRGHELAEIEEHDAEVVRSGKLIVAEERWTGKDGMERIYRSTKGPWARADGTVGIIGFTVDITVEQTSKQQAREAERRFQNLFENVPTILWLTDENGRIVLRNNVWTSYTGQPNLDPDLAFVDLVHPDDLEQFLDRWDFAVDNQELLEHDVRLQDQLTGAASLHRLSLIPVYAKQGGVTGWVGSALKLEH